MEKIVQCIPNFSEGRRTDVLEALAETARSVPGAMLLDYSSDTSHNRSVFTLVGNLEGIEEAAFALTKKAAELIDLRKHTGAHPRMGAVDVLPFVPIKGVSMEECVHLSKRVAERIYHELQIPSFFYEEAASSPQRVNLADVRRGEFEGMAEKLLMEEWAPDVGEREVHPSAGIMAIGARMPLIAYNVILDTDDIAIADRIAKMVRGSSGGFKYCKAIGVMMEDRGKVQVSMNMVNYLQTPLYRVFEVIKREAARYGVQVLGSEIVGMTPAKALVDTAGYYLQLEAFEDNKQVLENALMAMEKEA